MNVFQDAVVRKQVKQQNKHRQDPEDDTTFQEWKNRGRLVAAAAAAAAAAPIEITMTCEEEEREKSEGCDDFCATEHDRVQSEQEKKEGHATVVYFGVAAFEEEEGGEGEHEKEQERRGRAEIPHEKVEQEHRAKEAREQTDFQNHDSSSSSSSS